MKDKHPIDEFFRNGVKGMETKPSASAWDKIQAEIGEGKGEPVKWPLLRAAAVTLLVALSTYVYYLNEDTVLVNPGTEVTNSTETGTQNTGQVKPAERTEAKPEQNTTPSKERKTEKVVPIMKTGTPVFVAEQAEQQPALPEQVDEEELLAEEVPAELLTASLDEERVEHVRQPKVKVKLRVKPVTGSAFYAGADLESGEPTTKAPFKEKLYAYANNQLGNLMSGKLPELPRVDKSPQVEINLGRIFNN